MSGGPETRGLPFVSVIVPAYNDAARLKLCLAALEEQTYPAESYEVAVVDNGSSENIACVCKRFEHAVYVQELKPGSYAARNKGIEVARGDVLAFTDADCIPRRTWIERGVARLLSVPGCGLVGGRVEVFFRDANRPTMVELYDGMFAFQQRKYIEKQKYSVTANLFASRSVFDVVGLFDSKRKSGGDREWCRRAFVRDYRLVYADDAVVAHPARLSLKDFVKKELRLAGGAYHEMTEANPSFVYFLRQLLRIIYYSVLKLKELAAEDLPMEQKVKVALVVMIRRPLWILELARLRLGGEARR